MVLFRELSHPDPLLPLLLQLLAARRVFRLVAAMFSQILVDLSISEKKF